MEAPWRDLRIASRTNVVALRAPSTGSSKASRVSAKGRRTHRLCPRTLPSLTIFAPYTSDERCPPTIKYLCVPSSNVNSYSTLCGRRQRTVVLFRTVTELQRNT
ncbi:unnamed protein product [Pylaiella littoralis]